jgi:hypothetical protein
MTNSAKDALEILEEQKIELLYVLNAAQYYVAKISGSQIYESLDKRLYEILNISKEYFKTFIDEFKIL